MGCELIGLALPRQTTESLQSTAEELIKVALDRTAADASKACDLVMRGVIAPFRIITQLFLDLQRIEWQYSS